MATVITSMQWALNSPAPMRASDVDAVMHEELAHWEQVLDVRLMRNKLRAMEAAAAKLSAEPEQDSPTQRTDSHAAVIMQMRAGIAGAAAVAASMGRPEDARFSVTICGHVGMDYTGGVEERMQVFVDAAAAPRAGWPGT